MNKSDQNKLMITAMMIVGLLMLKCMTSGNAEHMDASTAEWVEQPTDIVMPSVNEEILQDRLYPTYHPNVKVSAEPSCVDDDVSKSHLIFKDGNVPRDYLPESDMQYPEEVLDAAELLPDDENNTWTDVNPSGTGSIAYKNFLDVGHHIGQINVLSKNASLDLRAQIPTTQFNVGPWANSTILPNVNLDNHADLCA
jgi:hypothetical protein